MEDHFLAVLFLREFFYDLNIFLGVEGEIGIFSIGGHKVHGGIGIAHRKKGQLPLIGKSEAKRS